MLDHTKMFKLGVMKLIRLKKYPKWILIYERSHSAMGHLIIAQLDEHNHLYYIYWENHALSVISANTFTPSISIREKLYDKPLPLHIEGKLRNGNSFRIFELNESEVDNFIMDNL